MSIDILDHGLSRVGLRFELEAKVMNRGTRHLAAQGLAIYAEDSYTGIGQLGETTDATPGVEKWYREHGFKV